MARKIKIDNAVLKRLERKQQKEIKCKKILCRILIVCEGEKTEPQYFKKFKAKNNNSFTYEVKCEGCGEGTMKVVNTAIELAKKAEFLSQPFDSVWAVFDKDNFADFNAVYSRYFPTCPARSCVAVKTLPKNVLCEIEAIAVL